MPTEDGKKAKSTVRYGVGGDHCGVCRVFLAPDACEKGRGDIHEDMWCQLFKRWRPPIAAGAPWGASAQSDVAADPGGGRVDENAALALQRGAGSPGGPLPRHIEEKP